jgi:hypothetical protein
MRGDIQAEVRAEQTGGEGSGGVQAQRPETFDAPRSHRTGLTLASMMAAQGGVDDLDGHGAGRPGDGEDPAALPGAGGDDLFAGGDGAQVGTDPGGRDLAAA